MRTAFPHTAARFPSAGCSRLKEREAGPPARPFSRCCFRLLRRDLRAKFAAMTATTLMRRDTISISDFRCTARPDDAPFVERHCCHSISYVRKGSFGCQSRGHFFELVTGSVLVGHPGDEYVCTHEHVCGDECLSFFLGPQLLDEIGERAEVLQIGAAPPLPELMVLGELAQAAADGRSDVGLEEAGVLFASRFVQLVPGRARQPTRASGRDRRRAVETAHWIEAHSNREVDLEQTALQADFSPFHF